MEMVNARKPHFLEVFLPALCSNRLKVPTRFIKHLAGRTSGSILLTGPSDNSWHVDLIEHNGHLFFGDGWSIFVKDHSIECGDSLVFRYDGNSHFTVQIFDQSSCEKEEAFQAKCSQEQSNPNGCLGKKRERGREAAISNVFSEKKFRGELVTIHLDSPGRDRDHELEMCCNEDQEMKESVINGSDNKMLALSQFQAYAGSVVIALPALSNDENMLAIIKSNKDNNASKVKNVSSKNFKVKKACLKKKKIVTEKTNSISKFIEARAAHYFTSSFPYFVRVITRFNMTKGTLRVPMKFSNEHLPDHRTKVVLRNLDGECWELNCIPTVKLHSTMHIFSGGWLAFARCNGIKIEDVCIFELVDKLEMRVHILRLGLEGLESQTQQGTSDAYGVRAAGSPLQNVENAPEDNEVHPSKIPEQTGDPNINVNVEQETDLEMTPETQETEYFIDISDDASALMNPDNFAPFLLPGPPNESTDDLLAYDADQTISYGTSVKSRAELDATGSLKMPRTADDETAAHSFASPFPSFTKVMTTSNVYGSASLAVPAKFSAKHLPTHKTEMVVRNLRGDCWNVIATYNRLQTKFCGGWPPFVRDNGVKVGDVCIFELIDDKVFQVHIVDGGHMGPECPSNDFVCDDPTTSIESKQCTHLPEP